MSSNLHSVNHDSEQELVKNEIRFEVWLRYQVPSKFCNLSNLLKSNKNMSNSTILRVSGTSERLHAEIEKSIALRERG
ncbi:hypothetical protein VNO80_09151 [Phaseolus coccineus]|uniref:Uncharacterized protein n=1 Tax=Phaseolus coccineus TaxID=3886 RepID=A0AAN9RCF2_PHACN